MRSRSRAQRTLMERVASDPGYAKERGISQKVAQEFLDADGDGKIDDLPERAVAAPSRPSTPSDPAEPSTPADMRPLKGLL